MKKLLQLTALLAPLALAACGYKLGGFVSPQMTGMKTFSVNMFENHTVYPNMGMQITSSIGNAMQTDGTFRMAVPSNADFTISGAVRNVKYERLLTDWRDSYQSLEVAVNIDVEYRIVNNKTGETISSGSVTGTGSYFNTGGNTQLGRDAALSFATRKAADQLVARLTTP